MPKGKLSKEKTGLLSLMNVGQATYRDFQLLGVASIEDLAQACPDELYLRIQRITAQRHDPCVWDVFAAAIHEARTGQKQVWWEWTKVRIKRQDEGSFIEYKK